jgi:DNA-binding transcriptional LysR family regulator
VAEQPLLVYNERDYPEYWENVASWLRAHKLRPRIGGEYDGSQSLLAAVEAGLGVAVVASRSTRLLPGRARYLNITSAPPPLCIAAACPTQRLAEPALASLLAELKTAGAALG